MDLQIILSSDYKVKFISLEILLLFTIHGSRLALSLRKKNHLLKKGKKKVILDVITKSHLEKSTLLF